MRTDSTTPKPRRLRRAVTAPALVVTAIAGMLMAGSPAMADGAWSTTTSEGYYYVEVSSRSDGIFIATRLQDTNCNSSGVGLRVDFYDNSNTLLSSDWEWWSNGCHAGLRSQGQPFDAVNLHGRTSGYARIERLTGSSYLNHRTFWLSTYWHIG